MFKNKYILATQSFRDKFLQVRICLSHSHSGNDGARIIHTLLFHVLLLFKKSNPLLQPSKVVRLEAYYEIKRSKKMASVKVL